MKTIFMSRFAPVFISTILCSCTVATQLTSLKQLRISDSSTSRTELYKARLSAVKKAPNFGFRNIIANSIFVQFLQYFGDDRARHQNGYGDSPEYLAAAIRHDPYFRDLYVFLSGSTTLYAGAPERTVKVISEGLEDIADKPAPDSYYIWRYKGTDELLFLNDGESARISFEMAADWAKESDDKYASLIGQVSEQTARFLSSNPDSKLAQINAWGSVLANALDDDTRAHTISRIRQLGGDVVLTESGEFSIQYEKAEIESEDLEDSDI